MSIFDLKNNVESLKEENKIILDKLTVLEKQIISKNLNNNTIIANNINNPNNNSQSDFPEIFQKPEKDIEKNEIILNAFFGNNEIKENDDLLFFNEIDDKQKEITPQILVNN